VPEVRFQLLDERRLDSSHVVIDEMIAIVDTFGWLIIMLFESHMIRQTAHYPCRIFGIPKKDIGT
jgi:hypothetical protein